MSERISAADTYERHRIAEFDTEISYVDTGAGDPVVFLHGNPTSSYLWRNVVPHVERVDRWLAPDAAIERAVWRRVTGADEEEELENSHKPFTF